MESWKRLSLRIGLLVGLIILPSLPASVIAQPAAAQGSSRVINGHVVSGRFLEVWSSQGNEQASVYVNGLPITDRRPEISLANGKTYDTQWFERARYEAHPENKAPYDMSLGLLGVTLTEGRGAIDPATKELRNSADAPFAGIDKPSDADGSTKVWFQETRHSVYGKILEYWNKYGGLQQFGFPLSEQFQEVSPTDGKTYTVQYFERNRFEIHPENTPPYDVELGLLGVQQYKTTPVAAVDLPIAPPKGVTSTRDTLVIGMWAEPDSLFPLFGVSMATEVASRPIMGYLISQDTKDNFYPELAWYVPTVENGGAYFVGAGDDRHLVVKFKLRQGVRWSDGVEVTSNDVLYTYRMVMDPDAPVIDRTLPEKLNNVDNPNKYTVLFNFMSYAQVRDFYNKPGQDKEHFAFLKQFVDSRTPVVDPLYNYMTFVYPEHILGKIPGSRLTESSYARNPVGTGPFKLASWLVGSEIVLVANPNYNLTAPPLLKKIVIKIIPDTNQIIAQLKTGDIDAVGPAGIPAPSDVLDTLASAGQIVTYAPARSWEHIDFNLDKPVFKEKAVRQAIAYGINRQGIVDKISLGRSVVLNTFLPPMSWASMQNLDFAAQWQSKFPLHTYPYDPAKANRLLDQAGWTKGADGIRSKNGVRLSFEYVTTAGNKTREQITQLAQADLRAMGVDVRLKYVPGLDFFANDGILARRDFDFAEYSWILDVNPDGSMYDSNYIPSAENNYYGVNFPGYRNARFDYLQRAASNEMDRSKRAPMFAEMQSIFSEDLPTLPLYANVSITVRKSNLMNWEASGGIVSPTYRAAALYFK